jgi:hypothetical protein
MGKTRTCEKPTPFSIMCDRERSDSTEVRCYRFEEGFVGRGNDSCASRSSWVVHYDFECIWPKWTELQVPPWRFAIVWMEYSVSSQALATQDGCRITHEFQRYVSKDDASLRLEFYYGNGSSIAVIDFAPLVRALFWCGVRCSEQTTNATQVTRGILADMH